MKNILILLFLLTSFGLMSQNPSTPDTTLRAPKADSASISPAPPSAPAVPAVPKTPRVRKDTRPFRDRIDADISTSYWANSQQSSFNASLLISYMFPKIVSIGAGPVYVYSHRKDADADLNGFGGQVFVQARLLKFFHLWTSYQGLKNQYITQITYNPVSYVRESGYVDSWYAGAGLNLRLGKRGGFSVSVLYDFLYNKGTSPYPNAWSYQFGFGL